jgi:hypothetical protein
MGDNFARVNEEVQNHLKQLTGTINMPEGEDALEVLAGGWLDKEESFVSQISERNLEETDVFSHEEPRGGLIMTYSGSLITVGPLSEEGRKVEYASIGLRTDVPERAEKDNSEINGDIILDEPAVFSVGPVKQSSPVYKIAVVREEMEAEEEEVLLSEVTQMLTDEFVEVNKTIVLE